MNHTKSLRNSLLSSVAFFVAGATLALVATTIVSRYRNTETVTLKNVFDDELTAALAGEWTWINRRPGHGELRVTFNPDGSLEDDLNRISFESRWFCSDGTLYLVSRGIGANDDGKDYFFALVPEFDESGESVELAFPGQDAHATLKKPVART